MKLQNLDRRLLYLLLALFVGIPLVPGVIIPLPKPAITTVTQSYYDTIEKVAQEKPDKLVIVSCNFGAGTLAENLSQAEATVRHLMMKKLKFAIFAFNDPQGRELGQQVVDKLAKEYDYQDGRDFVNFGYRPPGAIVPLLKSAVTDLPGAIKTDVNGKKLETVPLMAKIKSADDISLIVEVAAANTLDTWLQYYQRAGKEPIATLYCPTSVMATEAVPLLDTGQLQGMLIGLKGAAEYEILLKKEGFATQGSASLSLSHLLIIGLIALGNIGMILERKNQIGGH